MNAARSDTSRADTSRADDTRRQLVVLHIGELKVSVGELENQLAELAPSQRLAYGATADAIRRTFVSDIVLPRMLLLRRAQLDELERQPATAYRLEQARAAATLRALRKQVDEGPPVSKEEVSAYYELKRTRYSAPARYRIWRILCTTRDEAQAVLDALTPDTTPKTFSDLARDHSQDKGTYLRGGDLGFVAEDGTTSEPGLRVDLAVVRAAAGVRDGEWVRSPIPEGQYFAVVWRRGTLRARSSTVTEAAPEIRDALRKERVKEKVDRLLESLRAARLRDRNDTPLDSLEPAD